MIHRMICGLGKPRGRRQTQAASQDLQIIVQCLVTWCSGSRNVEGFEGRFSTHRTPRSSLSSCRQKLSAAWSTSWPPRPQRAPAPLYPPAVARAILCMHASGLKVFGSGISSPWTREILAIRVGFSRAKLQRILCEFSPHRLAPASLGLR